MLKDALTSRLLDALHRLGTGPALGCEGTFLSGEEVAERVHAEARRLNDAGLQPGEVVFLATERGNPFWVDLIGTLLAGGCAVPISPGASPEVAEHMRRIARGPVPVHQPALILFTSGSTGLPKGVPITRDALLANAQGTSARHPMQPGDLVFAAIPFRFVSSISHFLVTLLGQGCFAGFERTLLPADYTEAVGRLRPQGIGGSPVHMRWLAGYQGALPPELRWVMSSGDRLPPEVTAALLSKHSPLHVQIAYGLTELAGRFCMLPGEAVSDAPQCVGTAIEGLTLEIRNEAGEHLPQGEEGRVYASGPCTFDGYLDINGLDRSRFQGAAFDTGDLGRIESNGLLQLTGRASDTVKVGGRMVSLPAIHDTLIGFPGIMDAAVLPHPHPDVGQVIIACYTTDTAIPPKHGDVMRHLRSRLEGSHIPFALVLLDAIPRTGSGKLDRAALSGVIADRDVI